MRVVSLPVEFCDNTQCETKTRLAKYSDEHHVYAVKTACRACGSIVHATREAKDAGSLS